MADDEEDEDEQLVDVGPQFDQGLEKFHLPYKVATVQEEFNQRAYWDQRFRVARMALGQGP